MAWCAPEGVKEGTRASGSLFVQHYKVWLQSHTLVPKLDLNQPAWELRVMQVQPKRINPWFGISKKDREGLTILDDPLLIWLLCHQSLGCARDACTVCWQMGCSHLWGPNASLGNAAYTLLPFSGPRLAHWWWEKHKALLSVQLSGSTRGSQGSDEHIHTADQVCKLQLCVFFPLSVGHSLLSFFPFCFSPSFYPVSLKWASVRPTSPLNYFGYLKSMDWILHLN